MSTKKLIDYESAYHALKARGSKKNRKPSKALNCIHKYPKTCFFCGRPYIPNKVGKPRKSHRLCGLADSAIKVLEGYIQATVWEDDNFKAAVRRRLFKLIVQCFNQPKYVRYAPGEDFEPAIPNQGTRPKKEETQITQAPVDYDKLRALIERSLEIDESLPDGELVISNR